MKVKKPIAEEEILAKMSPGGGWTREQLAEWGVSWPPPKGWKQHILQHGVPYSEVIEIFGGGSILAENMPLFCAHCDSELIPEYQRLWNAGAPVTELTALLQRRLGKIVQATWQNGRRQWQCSCCGREARNLNEERKF